MKIVGHAIAGWKLIIKIKIKQDFFQCFLGIDNFQLLILVRPFIASFVKINESIIYYAVSAGSWVIARKIPISWVIWACLLYTSPSPRDAHESRMPSSA